MFHRFRLTVLPLSETVVELTLEARLPTSGATEVGVPVTSWYLLMRIRLGIVPTLAPELVQGTQLALLIGRNSVVEPLLPTSGVEPLMISWRRSLTMISRALSASWTVLAPVKLLAANCRSWPV